MGVRDPVISFQAETSLTGLNCKRRNEVRIAIKLIDGSVKFRERESYAPIFHFFIKLLKESKDVTLLTTEEYVDLVFPTLDCEIDFNPVKIESDKEKYAGLLRIEEREKHWGHLRTCAVIQSIHAGHRHTDPGAPVCNCGSLIDPNRTKEKT